MTVGPSWTYSSMEEYWEAVRRAKSREKRINYAHPERCFYKDWCYWPGCLCEREEGPVSVVLPWYCFDVPEPREKKDNPWD